MNYSIFTRLKHLLVSFHAQCRAQKFFFYFKKVSVCLFLFFYCYLLKYICVTIISLRDLNFSYFPLSGKHSQFLFLLRTGHSLPLLDQKEWFQTVSYIPYQYHLMMMRYIFLFWTIIIFFGWILHWNLLYENKWHIILHNRRQI